MSDKVIYICGDFSTNRLEDINCKCLILGNLASMYSVRTHPLLDNIDTSFDKTELFNTITRCHVFVFIFSKETVNETFYLNQFGIAKAHGVPVIGVREPSYFMPNPLPEKFYFTEIVDYTGDIRDGRSTRGVHTAKKPVLLADVLVQDFKTAMVYAPEFHRSCYQRLLHKVSQAFNRSDNEKKFYASVKEHAKLTPFNVYKESNISQDNIRNNSTKPLTCPKCGFLFNKQLTKTRATLQRASSTGSLLRKGDAFEGDTHKHFQNKKSTLQPTTIVIPGTSYLVKNNELKTRSLQVPNSACANRLQTVKVMDPLKSKHQTRSTDAVKEELTTKQGTENSLKIESCSKKASDEVNMADLQDKIKNKTVRKQSRLTTNGGWTDKLRMKLRRQSSLPVIPTTYLVTSPAGDKQLSFVKYPPDSLLLSPRQSLLPMFSEDEEQETIHISRTPSPDCSSWSEKEKEREADQPQG